MLKMPVFLHFPIGEWHFIAYIWQADAVGIPSFTHFSKGKTQLMAIKKATKAAPKKAAPKKAVTKAAPAKPKPIKEVLTKSALVAHLAETTAVAAKDVRAVLAALETTVQGSVSKKGAGAFTLPGLLKITAVSVPAKPRRKGINPFTKEEQWFAAKPASVKLKVRPLKKLKDAAA